MRSKAKHQVDTGRGHRARTALLVASLACVSLALLAAAPALAGTVTNQRPFLFSFDGADSTAGRFVQPVFDGELRDSVAVDDSTGAVYVSDQELRAVSKFNAAGKAEDFAATGTSSLFGGATPFTTTLGVAVDNSSVNPGRIYVSQFGQTELRAFDPAGSLLWALFPPQQLSDVAVDTAGHPWVAPDSFSGEVAEYDSTGSPPSQIGSIPVGEVGAIGADANGNVYLKRGDFSGRIDKYVGGVFTSTLDPGPAFDVYADQSAPPAIFSRCIAKTSTNTPPPAACWKPTAARANTSVTARASRTTRRWTGSMWRNSANRIRTLSSRCSERRRAARYPT